MIIFYQIHSGMNVGAHTERERERDSSGPHMYEGWPDSGYFISK
jgi:hypothetical protein